MKWAGWDGMGLMSETETTLDDIDTCTLIIIICITDFSTWLSSIRPNPS